MEEWRDVVGFEGVYSVSNFGHIRRDGVACGVKKGRILKTGLGTCPYHIVCLFKNHIGHTRTVHSIVARSFIGIRPEGFTINHKDCNKFNNRADNLEYLSRKDNAKHAIENNRIYRGTKQHLSKLKDDDILKIREIYKDPKMSQNAIAKIFNTTQTNIFKIVNRISWTHV